MALIYQVRAIIVLLFCVGAEATNSSPDPSAAKGSGGFAKRKPTYKEDDPWSESIISIQWPRKFDFSPPASGESGIVSVGETKNARANQQNNIDPFYDDDDDNWDSDGEGDPRGTQGLIEEEVKIFGKMGFNEDGARMLLGELSEPSDLKAMQALQIMLANYEDFAERENSPIENMVELGICDRSTAAYALYHNRGDLERAETTPGESAERVGEISTAMHAVRLHAFFRATVVIRNRSFTSLQKQRSGKAQPVFDRSEAMESLVDDIRRRSSSKHEIVALKINPSGFEDADAARKLGRRQKYDRSVILRGGHLQCCIHGIITFADFLQRSYLYKYAKDVLCEYQKREKAAKGRRRMHKLLLRQQKKQHSARRKKVYEYDDADAKDELKIRDLEARRERRRHRRVSSPSNKY
eukprot:jgi/Bigna1/85728/estExt_fgenesh1_pg.C_50356